MLEIALLAVEVQDDAEGLRLSVAANLIPCEDLAFGVRLEPNCHEARMRIPDKYRTGRIHLPGPECSLRPA